MTSTIDVTADKKELQYEELIPQLKGLIEDDVSDVANYANVAAALNSVFGFLWIGFYYLRNDQLELGPFQGPVACTKINYGSGVCGTCWQEEKTQIVEDVDQFPGHIACSSASKSEIVVPIWKNNAVVAVLDIDSDQINNFDRIDQKYLEIIAGLL